MRSCQGHFDSCGVIKRAPLISWSPTPPESGALLLSPLLDGIHVSEEQQDLPAAALRSLREEQVVAGDTQRPSAGRVQRLPEDNVLHVGRLDVLRKLHSSSWGGRKTQFSPPELLLPTCNHFLDSGEKMEAGSPCALSAGYDCRCALSLSRLIRSL